MKENLIPYSMKTKLLCISLLMVCAASQQVLGCTTFLLRDAKGNLYFGRNFDFPVGEGLIQINERNVQKSAMVMPPDKMLTWVSLYGSITFNQVGREFPYGGMNEAGLVVEQMWLDEAKYPEADERYALSELQWIQYQLDRAATVQEVIDSDTMVRISDKPFSYLHYLVSDALGNSAVIEFLAGKMVVHTDDEMPTAALANCTYEQSLRYSQELKLGEAEHYDEVVQNSSGRFAKAAAMTENYSGVTDPVDYSFAILDSVAQGEHTRWSIVYDITRMKICFRTLVNPLVQYLDMHSFDFSCGPRNLYRSIDETAPRNGGFLPLTPAVNIRALEKMKATLPFLKELPLEYMTEMSQYYQSMHCSKE